MKRRDLFKTAAMIPGVSAIGNTVDSPPSTERCGDPWSDYEIYQRILDKHPMMTQRELEDEAVGLWLTPTR